MIVGFFDWFNFRKQKPASKDLTLKSIEFPWPKDINHYSSNKHWMESSCDGSTKKAKATEYTWDGKGYRIKWGDCSACGKKGRVTKGGAAYRHLSILSVS